MFRRLSPIQARVSDRNICRIFSSLICVCTEPGLGTTFKIYAPAIAREYKGPIHLMISHVVMPQMGGARLAAELVSERPGMKVRFVSGYAETTVHRHGAIDVTPASCRSLSRLDPRPIWGSLDPDAPVLAAAASV